MKHDTRMKPGATFLHRQEKVTIRSIRTPDWRPEPLTALLDRHLEFDRANQGISAVNSISCKRCSSK